jgi:hypothetical protein
MNTLDRGTMAFGGFLIGMGGIFLIFNLIPGLDMGKTWPVIFYLLAGAFLMPGFVFQPYRKALASLFIPGSILLALALIFTYNVLTDDFAAWAYAWLLIPAGVGLGLLLAATVGEWGKGTREVGVWLMSADIGLFALFATVFGQSQFIKLAGPILIIIAGALILMRVFRK